MIPYDLDPSLYATEPEPPVLDDGFSPPHHGEPHDAEGVMDSRDEIADDGDPDHSNLEPALGPKSLF
jgi:hypothetical protein